VNAQSSSSTSADPGAIAPLTASFGTVPAASVIGECLRLQALTPARSAAARLFGRSPLTELSRSWYLGALGELVVAKLLAGLPAEWTVLHSVPVGSKGSDIDHLVIGPGGVFTVNTKFHAGASIWVGARRLMVNGRKTDYLRNSRFEAGRVSRMLGSGLRSPLPVTPLLVFVYAKRITIRERPPGVVVLRETHLARWLTRMPVTVSPEQLAVIRQKAATPSTWGAGAGGTVIPTEFAALQRKVQAARRVRTAWVLGVVLAALSVVPLVLTTVVAVLSS
jgi:hypothetical protein